MEVLDPSISNEEETRYLLALAQIRTLVDLTPRFEKQANKQLVKETVLEYSSEFWLNKYLAKELTLLRHSYWMNIVLTC